MFSYTVFARNFKLVILRSVSKRKGKKKKKKSKRKGKNSVTFNKVNLYVTILCLYV